MKLQLSTRLVSIIGIIILTLYFPPSDLGIREVYGIDPGSSIGVIDLEIESSIDLESTSSIQFSRTFSVPEKQEVYLLHIDAQSSENTIKEVFISANINTIMTNVSFKDSSSSYISPHSFYGGTRLSFQIDPDTPVFSLQNTLNLSIEVDSSSLFGNLGTFQILSVKIETIFTPIIEADSAETVLPLEVSRGTWYIAPLSTLNERKIQSKLFCNIIEDTILRLDIEFSPSDYPLTTTNFEVLNGATAFEGESSELNPVKGIVYAEVTKGDSLILKFSFRPTSDLANSVIELEATVKATPVTVIPDNGPSGSDEGPAIFDVNFLGLALPDLQLLRFSMIIVPLFFYFNRNKKRNEEQNSDLIKKGDIFGTNEK